MAYRTRINLLALTDIEEAIEYYEKQRFGLGNEFLIEFLAFTDLIAKHPTHFTAKNPPYRRALMKKFPYAIHFGVNDKLQEVIVLAVWHVRRDPVALRERLK